MLVEAARFCTSPVATANIPLPPQRHVVASRDGNLIYNDAFCWPKVSA